MNGCDVTVGKRMRENWKSKYDGNDKKVWIYVRSNMQGTDLLGATAKYWRSRGPRSLEV
jgi:hypothetical protein